MSAENNIDHQFLNSKFFLPNWKMQTLVLGTFNPSCGEDTDYFYGRCQNNFWRTIEEINNLDYRWFQNNFERKLKFMKENAFGCTDIIKSIVISDGVERKAICGYGYSDQILFTAKKCTLTYHFEEIKSFIKKNNVSKIINTWGKRESPADFKKQVAELKTFCKQNNVLYIDECPSPSGRLRGKEHKKHLAEFYKLHLLKTSL
jgi:G:T/U-mismatch repair DNA glycosylase